MISTRSDDAEVPARAAEAQGAGRKPRTNRLGAELGAATSGRTKSEDRLLMEQVVERSNLQAAYQRVVQNKGAPGVDNVSVPEFKDWLKVHWPSVKSALLEGRYLPRPVRRVDIPKPSGGIRTLGVPTVVDRLIQQALHQVLQSLFEPTFSVGSFGFRPGRGAHQAVRQAQAYIRAGKRWVVDIDLEKFFDRVNHDVLMARVARQVSDARVLKLIRRYLAAGMMSGGLVEPRTEGTPQGGPLSPLLSNILLNDLDQELERRQLAFCRYADDCNIYVGSRAAGERVMRGVRTFLEEVLKLRINTEKSAVARPWQRKFLGFSVTVQRESRLRIAPASVQRLTQKVRDLIRAGRGWSLAHTIDELNPLLRGWINYFQLTQSHGVLAELDGWVRRRLRCLLWRQWKRARTRVRHLRALGLSEDLARWGSGSGRGPWWNAGAQAMNCALSTAYFTRKGLVSLLGTQQRLQSLS
jgi:group II intron reverse transcriptase/maturase